MFDRCYCINSTIYLLKFGKLHGTIFCHRLAASELVHIFSISVFLARAHQEIQDGCHHSIRPRCFENDSTRWLLYNFRVVYKTINKNGERSTFICNNFHAERAQSFPLPSCSSWEQKLCNMFSFTIVLLSV